MCADTTDYFLVTPINCVEYMRIKSKHTPLDIHLKYNLADKVTPDDYFSLTIKQGMYGLKQATLLAHGSINHALLPMNI